MGKDKTKVVILLGPPGAGKGTQADILAERGGFYHFETAKIIEEQIASHEPDETVSVDGKEYRYGDEEELFRSGKLNTPELVAFWVAQKIRELAKDGRKLVFSSSPRTLLEAQTLLPILVDLYGRDAIRGVWITLPAEHSIFRNTNRRICKNCRAPLPFFPETEGLTACPKCGGALMKRGSLDTPEVIRVRLQEYEERTVPIVEYLRDRGIVVNGVDGLGGIAEVAQRVENTLEL